MGVFYTAVSPMDWARMMSDDPAYGVIPRPGGDYKTFWMMETMNATVAETDDIVADSAEYDFVAQVIRIEVTAESLGFFKKAEIRSSGRTVWTILGKTWDKCSDGIKFIAHEREVGRERQAERRRAWLLKDERKDLEWSVELVRGRAWAYEPVPCHDHCAVCVESLCSIHPEQGNSHAFRAIGTEHDVRMCGRCYAALLEISREQA